MTTKIINITLFMVLFLLPLIILPIGFFPNSYNIPKIILLYGCGIILLICLFIKYKELKFDKLDILLLSFLILVCISTIFSVNVKESIFGTNNRYEGLFTFICYFLIYYSSKYFFKFNKKFIIFSMICLLITNILAILQYYDIEIFNTLFNSDVFGDSFASATFGNRNFYGSFLSICMPYTMCLYLFKNKKTYLFISSLSFFGLLVSLTRSAWFAYGITLIFVLIYIIKLKDKNIILNFVKCILIYCLLFIIFYFSKSDLFTQRFEETKNEISNITNTINDKNIAEINTNTSSLFNGRFIIWEAALRIIFNNPFWGCGPDTFFSEICTNHVEFLVNKIYPTLGGFPDKAHNEYLQIAATIGIPALIIYLTFLILTLKKISKTKLTQNKQNFIIFICLISYLIQAFTNISTIGVAPIFYFLLGYSNQINNTIKLNEKKLIKIK